MTQILYSYHLQSVENGTFHIQEKVKSLLPLRYSQWCTDAFTVRGAKEQIHVSYVCSPYGRM